MNSNQISLAVAILAAGKGKRMNDPTKSKVMFPVAGLPMIQHVLKQASALKPEKTVLIVGHQKESIINYITSLNLHGISFVEQTQQLGTGHAILQTQSELFDFDGVVLILSGDVPLLRVSTLQKFLNNHIIEKSVVSVLTTQIENPTGYGRIVRNNEGIFIRIIEEKDATPEEKKIKEINGGIYLVDSKLLFLALNSVENNNSQGEYYLTDIISILKSQNYHTSAFCLASFDELHGVNSLEDLQHAENLFSKF